MQGPDWNLRVNLQEFELLVGWLGVLWSPLTSLGDYSIPLDGFALSLQYSLALGCVFLAKVNLTEINHLSDMRHFGFMGAMRLICSSMTVRSLSGVRALQRLCMTDLQ